MSKKFDGPSFINPNHTSFGLENNGKYQTPNLNNLNSDELDNVNKNNKDVKRKVRGGNNIL
jgi:hypothetical protein